jgi:hypothetical protein
MMSGGRRRLAAAKKRQKKPAIPSMSYKKAPESLEPAKTSAQERLAETIRIEETQSIDHKVPEPPPGL